MEEREAMGWPLDTSGSCRLGRGVFICHHVIEIYTKKKKNNRPHLISVDENYLGEFQVFPISLNMRKKNIVTYSSDLVPIDYYPF